MSNTYVDLEQVSDTSVETMIVHDDENFKDQRYFTEM